jgi:hypothetical protein
VPDRLLRADQYSLIVELAPELPFVSAGDKLGHPLPESERRCVAKGYCRAAFYEPAGRVPLSKRNCVIQRRATTDYCAVRFQVRARVE